MKKEVQALLKRRRARFVPVFLAGLAGLILLALVLLVASYFTRGPGQTLLRTSTPTTTLTPTPVPATATPSSTPTPESTSTPTLTPGPSPTPAPISYTVQSGDTLYGISIQFNVDLCQLMAANQVTDPGLVSVGQVLIIPLAGFELPTPTPLPTGLPRGARMTYVVQCGDSLQSIAARFNSTAEDIAKVNNITDLANIQVGLTLTVRANIATPTPAPSATPAPAVTATP